MARQVTKEEAVKIVTQMILDPAVKISDFQVERDEIECEPVDGYRTFRPGPFQRIKIKLLDAVSK